MDVCSRYVACLVYRTCAHNQTGGRAWRLRRTLDQRDIGRWTRPIFRRNGCDLTEQDFEDPKPGRLVKHRQEGVRNVLWCRVARPGNVSVPLTMMP
jgi:hypothetical protein